eukprot:1933286-Rhodomonas_salina.5
MMNVRVLLFPRKSKCVSHRSLPDHAVTVSARARVRAAWSESRSRSSSQPTPPTASRHHTFCLSGLFPSRPSATVDVVCGRTCCVVFDVRCAVCGVRCAVCGADRARVDTRLCYALLPPSRARDKVTREPVSCVLLRGLSDARR